MADFRRVVTALAVVVLLMGFAQTVSAQPFTCSATAAVTPLLRSEGLTELTGDIVLTCSGTLNPAQAALSPVNITLFMNAPVTSRILSGSTTEATLLLDEGTATMIQGTVAGQSLSFVNVPIIPASTVGVVQRIVRITNIRVNAATVPAGISGVPPAVQALISITGPATVPISNPSLTVGFVSQGLVFGLNRANDFGTAVSSGGLALDQCVEYTRSTLRAILRFREGFATAFKIRATASQLDATPDIGQFFNTESGTVLTGLTGTFGGVTTAAGLADFNTRLRAVFTNVPAGVQIWVSTDNVTGANVAAPSTGNTYARLISPEAAGLAGAFDIPAGTTSPIGLAQLSVVGGVATAVWEVRSADPALVENLDFQVHIVTSPAPGSNTPAAGVLAAVNGSFAPVSTAVTVNSGPIPRFRDAVDSPRNFLQVNICRTVLLFPFVTNQAGFDTGLAISNTSQDPLGTAAQAGTCTWNFYGANAPAAVTTASVAAGTTVTALASSVAPNFQGYAFAVCNFQFAHGFAFVSDIGARNLAMGYLSLVVPGSRSGTEALDN